MELRDHPLMVYHGMRNWPPAWMWRGGEGNKKIRGEIGILKDVFLSKVDPNTRLFLIVQHEDNEYVGCVMFNDSSSFCRQVYELLQKHYGRRIADIGSLDVSHLL